MGKRIGTRIVRAVRTLVLTGLLALALPSLASASNLYVTNYESDTVSVIDGTSNRVISTIPTGSETGPFSIAITPDGRTAWVGNFDSGTVISIDTATNQVVGAPIPIRPKSFAMAITPDGSRAYIANHEDDSVTAIELATRQVIGTPIQVCDAPTSLTISPDGRTLFVVCQGSGGEEVMVDIGLGLLLGGGPRVTIEKGYGSAITPDGNRLYLASEAGFVTVVDALSNSSIGERIPVGVEPDNFAITPDGLRAYVADFNEKGQVHVIDTSSRQLVGAPIDIKETEYAASSPDGRKVFFSQFGPDTVTGLDTTTNQVIGPIPTGKGVGALAFVPDQSPTAAFKLAKRVRPGVAATLDGSPSSDSDGTVSSWSWVFQGGAGTGTTKPKLKHTFAKPGKFKVTLTVTDNEGCSINLVFTGQTAYCHGSPAATVTKTVKVAYPGVKVRCPKSASGACSFRLKAVERHGKKLTAQSAVAKAKAKPGKTAVVTLKPKKKFAKKLAGAKKALVQQIVTIAGRQTTKVSKLKIVR